MTKKQLAKLQKLYSDLGGLMDDLLNAMEKDNKYQFAFFAGQYAMRFEELGEFYNEKDMQQLVNDYIDAYNHMFRKKITREQFNDYWTDVVIDRC